MNESPLFRTIKVVVLVIILALGAGVLVTGVDQDRTNTTSIEEP